MLLAWTTVATRADAERLAHESIQRRLAVCAQIEGPIASHYRWQGQVERSEEFRLCFKVMEPEVAALEQYVTGNHPYETPEWISVRVEAVGENYLSWAKANSSNPPL
jgi:periplasmic divalent cation tolerance protein